MAASNLKMRSNLLLRNPAVHMSAEPLAQPLVRPWAQQLAQQLAHQLGPT
jgi:hypothetical protein